MRHKRSQVDHERFIKILEKEKAEFEELLYFVTPQKMAQMSHLTLLWCPRLDLNQHAVRHMLLRHTCIPISPLGHADII